MPSFQQRIRGPATGRPSDGVAASDFVRRTESLSWLHRVSCELPAYYYRGPLAWPPFLPHAWLAMGPRPTAAAY
eukprot:COSAG01_NODE_657_length_14457_cov_99.379649_3_plen_74_part_00